MTRKWNIVNDQSNGNYDVENEIIYNTEDLKSHLCDYNDTCIVVKGNIVTIAHNNPTPVVFIYWMYHNNWWNNNKWCWGFRYCHDNVQSDRE